MTNLRDSSKQTAVKALHANFWGELLDADENYAESYLKWCITQLKENKNNAKHIALKGALKKSSSDEERFEISKQMKYVKPKGHPLKVNAGDVVLVRYGINLGDEISDLQRDQTMKDDPGHYSVVIKQRGFMFLVVPLSSQRQVNKENPHLEMSIKELGIGDASESHVVFTQIRFVHIRRIKNIQSLLPDGKTSLDPVVFKELKGKISEFLDITNEKKAKAIDQP